MPGVSGVLVVDSHGLAVASNSKTDVNFSPTASGYVSSLVKTASQLSEEELPVVAVELERSFILIHKHEDVTLAVNKSK
jgi:predicted regulator of Ras-like GTPase activity (Roadblock/LC7/MglB family)